MTNLIIAKSTAGVWSFQKSSNGTLTDGTKYSGPKITVGSENGEFILNNDGSKMYFKGTNVYYNDTNYTSVEEVLDALATDGLSVNFNTGGVSPQNNIPLSGILIPRLTTEEKLNIENLVTSMLVFDTDLNQFNYFDGVEWVGFEKKNNANSDENIVNNYIYNGKQVYRKIIFGNMYSELEDDNVFEKEIPLDSNIEVIEIKGFFIGNDGARYLVNSSCSYRNLASQYNNQINEVYNATVINTNGNTKLKLSAYTQVYNPTTNNGFGYNYGYNYEITIEYTKTTD